MSRKPSIAVCALAALIAAAASPLAARAESWRGRFVQLPDELSGVAPSLSLEMPINASTYAGICALGDMAMERKYVPSKGGAASAPAGPLLTCMAEEGWETPNAARHAQLYDLVYGEIKKGMGTANTDAVTVYPLAIGEGLDIIENRFTDQFGIKRYEINYANAPHPAHLTALDSKTWLEPKWDPALEGLRKMLESHDIDTQYDDPYAEHWRSGAADSYANGMYAEYGFHCGSVYAYEEYLRNGTANVLLRFPDVPPAYESYMTRGIQSGGPLYRGDPLEAYYIMKKSNVSPVAIAAGAGYKPQTHTTKTTTTYSYGNEDIAQKVYELAMGGGGTVVLTPSVSVKEEKTDSEGKLEYEYTKSRNDRTHASILITYTWQTTTLGAGAWQEVGPGVSKRIVGHGTIVELVSATVYVAYDPVVDIVETTKKPDLACAVDVGWPHSSSAGWLGEGSLGYIFGRKTERTEYKYYGIGEDPPVVTNVASVCNSFGGEMHPGMQAFLNTGMDRYIEPFEERDIVMPVGLTASVPTWKVVNNAKYTTDYRFATTNDFGDVEYGYALMGAGAPTTDDPRGEPVHQWESEDADSTTFPHSQEDVPTGYEYTTTDNELAGDSVSVSEEYEYAELISEGTANGDIFAYSHTIEWDAPSVFAFVLWNFTNF